MLDSTTRSCLKTERRPKTATFPQKPFIELKVCHICGRSLLLRSGADRGIFDARAVSATPGDTEFLTNSADENEGCDFTKLAKVLCDP